MHIVNTDEYIISLEGLFYTEENTYICTRTPTSIGLFINEFFIKKMKDLSENSYINFKIIKPYNLIEENTFIIITIINKDFSSYAVHIIDIVTIFPSYTRFFQFLIFKAFG